MIQHRGGPLGANTARRLGDNPDTVSEGGPEGFGGASTASTPALVTRATAAGGASPVGSGSTDLRDTGGGKPGPGDVA